MNYTKFYKILVINNIMKHFFLERHCVYDKATKGLNKEGFLQAMIMAQEIKRIADNYHNVVLISSPARRAQETVSPTPNPIKEPVTLSIPNLLITTKIAPANKNA